LAIPAGRVLAGTVQRGEVQGAEAVLLFTDLCASPRSQIPAGAT
jgi:hypothetical protein